MALVFIKRTDGTKNKYRLPAKEGLVIPIGRNPDCIISLPDIVGMSGLHCSITHREGSFYISDNGSTNGTYRLDTRLSAEEPLQEGVEYKLGEAILTYDAQGAPVPALPAAATAAAGTPPLVAPAPASAAPAAAPDAGSPPRPPRRKKNPFAVKRAGYDPKKKEDGFAPVFAVIIVIVSLLAGMTLRHWKDTGGFFPSDALSDPPAPAAAKPAAAAKLEKK